MKSLEATFRTLRDAPKVVKTLRKVELISLGKELILGAWTDEGRLGNQLIVHSLEEYNGDVYGGAHTNGHVYRYDGTNNWTDCGQPTGGLDLIFDLKVFNGDLYCGVGNGHVYRYDGGTAWIDMGLLAITVYALAVLNNKLYASTGNTGHVYRFDGPANWASIGQPLVVGEVRSLIVFEDTLYAGTGDTVARCRVYRWNGGTSWTNTGALGVTRIVRCLEVVNDKLYGGCYNNIGDGGHVFRYDGIANWVDCGQLGISTDARSLIVYGGRLYGGGWLTGKFYRYEGGTSWTDLGQLDGCNGLYCFLISGGILFAGTGNSAKVFTIEATTPPTDISTYVENVGQITKRLERELNQFQPSTVPITVNNEDIFIKADKSGLLDYDNLANGYQVKVYVGLTGSTQWVLMFDGKLNPDSVKMPDRQTVKFTATGWLDDAKNYNAELVADPENPPFKNITGITFITTGFGTQLGAKTLEFGIESSGAKWLSFDGGAKVITVEDEDLWFFDSVKESSIKLTIDYSELPTEGQEDKFTIIEEEDMIIACGWWENKKLEFIVDELMKKIGIIDRDIQVQEIEDIISQEKNFIFVGGGLPHGNITAFRVVEIDATHKVIRCLVGITGKNTLKCFVYLLRIDYNAQHCTSKYIFELGSGQKAMKFMKFGNKWWVLISSRTPTFILPYARPFYHAYYLKNFDSNWDVDYSLALAGLYSFVYACSGSVLAAATNEIYFMGQANTGAPLWEHRVKLFKLTWNGVALVRTFIKTLETDDGTDDACFADEWATILPETTDDFYYYGIRKDATDTYLEIRKYSLVGNAFTTVLDVGVITGYIENFTRSTYVNSPARQGYFIYQETAVIDRAYWIGRTGILYEEHLEEAIKNLIYGNPDFKDYYSWWHYDVDGYHYIKSMYAHSSGEYKEAEKLDNKYSIEEVAPEIFEGALGGKNHVGIVMEKGSKVITPFLYMPGIVPVVQIADFTGMNCEQALTKLSEAYCCCLDIYEYQKARFYYRGTFNDSDTLDYDVYLRQPEKRYWKNWCDGVIVENSEKGIRSRIGTTDFGSRILTGGSIDNVFVSSQGMAKVIAGLLYSFYGVKKLVTPVSIPFYVESELLDKIVFTARDKDGNIWRTFNNLIYETSFNVSPGSDVTHDMELELLEMTGTTLHTKVLTDVDNSEIVKVV